MILQNQVRCNKCGDEPFSTHRHDFVKCECGSVAVDGGMQYLRRIHTHDDISNYTELSYSLDDTIVKDCIEAVKWSKETGRNELGTFLAVVRALKKHNRIIVDGTVGPNE